MIIDIKKIYGETAKLSLLAEYETAAIKLAAGHKMVTLTGAGPVWLYLRLSRALEASDRTLLYDSPVTGIVHIWGEEPTLCKSCGKPYEPEDIFRELFGEPAPARNDLLCLECEEKLLAAHVDESYEGE